MFIYGHEGCVLSYFFKKSLVILIPKDWGTVRRLIGEITSRLTRYILGTIGYLSLLGYKKAKICTFDMNLDWRLPSWELIHWCE